MESEIMESKIRQTLASPTARKLFGIDNSSEDQGQTALHTVEYWKELFVQNVVQWPDLNELAAIGNAAFHAFLQANVTGPPLTWDSAPVIFPSSVLDGAKNDLDKTRRHLILSLSVDGEAIYQLTPYIELLYVAKCIFNGYPVGEYPEARLARLRVNFLHQRLLSGISPTLQDQIYNDLLILEKIFVEKKVSSSLTDAASFLIERATIYIHHGFDAKARSDLQQAAEERSFLFRLTGRLGKRTKFQQKELSQLVVLAKSAESLTTSKASKDSAVNQAPIDQVGKSAPQNLNLDDDTLLESISFSKGGDVSEPRADQELPPALEALEPGNQPPLDPLDSIVLLTIASSITNTSPADGLTREATLPYAERVILGGSSNWQVYTQALLVRSRIESHKSRTLERGVLQLQALVDQVVAETTPLDQSKINSSTGDHTNTTSFLPQPKRDESAPLAERLQYINQLASSPRWMLESELADRWVSIGGLRTALEIYERLQLWAEVALCWAANGREDKACKIIRRQLYNPVITTSTDKLLEDDEDNNVGDYRIERDPLPADAPRLFCILGDLEHSAAAYERAWEVSNQRYARAQRSLGKLHWQSGDLGKADDAYAKSLRVNPQNHATWFTLGCTRLQTQNWPGAVDAFGRAVQIEDDDAESWSNLAIALLKLPPEEPPRASSHDANDDEEIDEDDVRGSDNAAPDTQKHVREAFVVLKRAAALKRDSFRIWQNLLSVSIQLSPPPYTDIVLAQTRLIDLLGKVEGEKCVDIDIVEALVSHLISTSRTTTESTKTSSQDDGDGLQRAELNEQHEPGRRNAFQRLVIELIEKKVTPLITSSRRLWLLVAKLSIHLKRPAAALSTYEKAWRVTLNQPSWESGGNTDVVKTAWRNVVDSTIDLADAYESLGERTKESGLGAGELVAKDWRFKARSALRSVLSRAKEGWEGDAGYESLSDRLQELKAAS